MPVFPSASGRFLFFLTLLLVFAAVPAPPAAADGLAQSRRTLQEIQQRIARTRHALAAKSSTEKSLKNDLATVVSDLARIRRQAGRINARLDKLDGELQDQQVAIAHSREHIAATRQRVRQRLVAMYKGGGAGLLRILFGSASPAGMAEEYDYFARIVHHDRQLLKDYRQGLDQLQQGLAQLQALRQEQQQALAQRRQEQATFAQAGQLKKELLAQVRRQRRHLSARLQGLKARARRLNALIKKLERNKGGEYTQPSGSFATQKGRLPWPVSGSVKVRFGTWRHPGLDTLYESQGIEIAAAGDSAIKAVWPGRVVFANWFKGYGKLLIIAHGGGYFSLYAQAARLTHKTGDAVTEGTIIGYSGSEQGRVYFGIRKGSTPLNPTAWLTHR